LAVARIWSAPRAWSQTRNSAKSPAVPPAAVEPATRGRRSPGHIERHLHGAAADSAEALHALAFTLGRDIYFSRGAFRPSSPDGLELLAHSFHE
jgi:hypothetical protein